MAIPAAEVAAVGMATASAAFRYNRENYMFDQGLRWGRFTTGYSMAMAQAAMYREDIRDLTAFTVTKADTYHTVGVIFFVLNFQLIMAGRLGVHGPSPPGWLLGLYWTNICTALMYLVTFTWLAMHAGARATAGAAFMLTRHVRLPIPSPAMLDKARKTGNSYEKQRVADVFRIPFIAPAPQHAEEDPETGKTVPVSDRRMPRWYRDETAELSQDEGGAAATAPGQNPEHFELYRGLQEEWWAYDVYARIGVFYFMSHWLTSASLYSMCHIFTELRCIWPAYTVTACFVAAHYGILQLDIVNKPREGSIMPPVERIVPFVPFICVVGMTLDYSILPVSAFIQGFIYFLSWICYAIQFAWAIRLYDLAAPQAQVQEREEVAGRPWWPAEWPLPPAFEDAVYMVGAPKTMDPSMPCLQQEMKAAKGKRAYEVGLRKAKKAAPPTFVWKLFRGASITTISMWVLIMVGRAFEQVNGERWLLKQEGRMERWPSHMQPWMSPWTRKGSRNEMCHAGGCDRRLSGAEMQQHEEIASLAQRLASSLGPLAEALDTPITTTPPSAVFAMPPLRAQTLEWPADFRPAHLVASQEGGLAALARTGHGAHLRLSPAGGVERVEPFALQGLAGEVLGASWTEGSLVVATSGGHVAECRPGAWRCQDMAAPALPKGLAAATVSHRPGVGGLRAAVKYEGEDSVLLLEVDLATKSWLPAGEVRAPSVHGSLRLALSGDELLVSSADGLVVSHDLKTGEGRKVAPAREEPGAAWHSACSMGHGGFAHLAGHAVPKLFLSGPSSVMPRAAA